MNTRRCIVPDHDSHRLPGTGNCTSIDTRASIGSHPDLSFATAQPGSTPSLMMGNGGVTDDTKSFQTINDPIGTRRSPLDRMQSTGPCGKHANAVQANIVFTDIGEPDSNRSPVPLLK